ncbi:MAG: hypothetical protein DWQ04_04935 [Chloroflexi bacterium]|nr:MAG: hypothetical protein DWQ04_04935 [Chloroflexota bacterium]
MNEHDLKHLLDEVKTARQMGVPPDAVSQSLRKLVNAHYQPALDFFLDCLEDQRQEWRAQCLVLVGLHYDLMGNEVALDKIRGVLQHDPDRQLRIKAAEMLALHSDWPDYALRSALENDPDNGVCFAACQAILELLGIPRMIIRDELARLYTSGIMPRMDDVKRIVDSVKSNRPPR